MYYFAWGDHLWWPCSKVARLQLTFVMKLALISWVWQTYLPTCSQYPEATGSPPFNHLLLPLPSASPWPLTPSRIIGDKCSAFDPSMELFTVGYRKPVNVSSFSCAFQQNVSMLGGIHIDKHSTSIWNFGVNWYNCFNYLSLSLETEKWKEGWKPDGRDKLLSLYVFIK